VVLVPLFSSIIFRHPVQHRVKAGVALAVLGLYLLCAGNSWVLNKGDFLAFLCAIFVAVHIIYTGRYSKSCDIYWLSTLQIGMVGALSVVSAVVTRQPVLVFHPQIVPALVVCVLFATIFAYLVQTTMQQFISPASTALIFCLEPVFAALCAYVVIGERLGIRGVVGGALMVLGMILPEISLEKLLAKKELDPESPSV
jgi:drug/metabolite transporter (DMT)-like permease